MELLSEAGRQVGTTANSTTHSHSVLCRLSGWRDGLQRYVFLTAFSMWGY